MSTALSQPFYFDPHEQPGRQLDAVRHLSPVPSEALDIRRVPNSANTEIQHLSALDLLSPAEQFAPDANQRIRTASSSLVEYGPDHEQELEYQRQISQQSSIKKMTQTIGAAFVEAELGLRPFRQLGSWISGNCSISCVPEWSAPQADNIWQFAVVPQRFHLLSRSACVLRFRPTEIGKPQ